VEEDKMIRRAVIAVLAGSLVGVGAYATIVPYDFTGHWTGTAHRPEKPDLAMLATDLTMTTPPTFTGAMTVVLTEETFHCTMSGVQRRRVVMTGPCDNTAHFTLRGALDVTSGTIAGRFVYKPPPSMHKPPRHGSFTLTKQT
jgi:hypothetical protein